MNANEYQKWTNSTAVFKPEAALAYLMLGLTGEAGEMANKAKKLIRDYDISTFEQMTPDSKEIMMHELGDVLWYAAQIAARMGYTLEQVMDANHHKLSDRKERNALKGSGDNR